MRRIASLMLCIAVTCSIVPFAAACAPQTKRGSYSIEAEYFPAERTLKAAMTVTVVNHTNEEWETLKFQLWPNAYRAGAKYAPVSALFAPDAYYAGESCGGIEVTAVEGAAAFRVAGEDENILEADLPVPLAPNKSAVLAMRFTVTLANVRHRLGVGEKTVNLAQFYPVLCHWEDGFCEHVYATGDPFVSETADYDVRLTVPDGYIAACSGESEKTLADGKATYRVRAENVREVAFVLSEDMRVAQTSADGIPISYYYFDDENAQATLSAAAESLSYFQKTFGDYIYPCYHVVQTEFAYGGMEFPMLSMIASDLRAEEVPAVVVHETAHQWWYAMVGSDQYTDAWQDEGLAAYSEALFFGAHPAYGTSYEEYIAASEGAYRAYFSVTEQLTGRQDTSMRRPLTAFSGDYEYRSIAYDKAVILFDRLRETLGEKRFVAALRGYAAAYTGKIAPAEALKEAFAKQGAHARGIMESFLSGACVI